MATPRITICTITGSVVGTITVDETTTGRQLLEDVSCLVGATPYCLHLLKESAKVVAKMPVVEQGVVDGTIIHLVSCEVPSKHDVVTECDLCDFDRFCYYGYSTSANGIKEPVIAVCEYCGGRPELDSDSDDEMTDCRDFDSERLV